MRTHQFLLASALLAACSRSEPPTAPVASPEPAAKQPPVAAPDQPAKPSIDDTTFRLALVGAPEYAADKEGAVELTLEARGGYHVNQDYPIRVDLKAPAGVKLAKASLGKPDAAKFSEQEARFQLPFSASAGAHDLTATVDFAVCTKETCVPDQRTVALALQVR
jgi:hypothetical protein